MKGGSRFLLPLAAGLSLSLCAQERVAGLAAVPVDWRNAGPGGGGWIQSLTWSRHAPDRLWVGCDVGGVYLSEDAGRHYVNRNTGIRNMYIEDIVERPTDSDVLFAASPGGLFKTVDRGAHWREIRKGLPKAEDWRYGAPISRIVFDPHNAQHVYAAVGDPRGHTRDGGQGAVYESADGGDSWRRMTNVVASGANVIDLSIDPRDGTLLVSSDRGVFRAGQKMRVGDGTLDGRLRRLARAPSNPDVIYLTVKHRSGETPWRAGVYRSDDGGTTWAWRSDGLDRSEIGEPGGSSHFTSWYDRIVVDPRNADAASVGGATWRCEGVWKTTDGGRSWRCAFSKADVKAPWLNLWGPDVRALALSPLKPARLAFGSAGYVYVSDDAGRTWSPRYTRDNGNGTFSSCGLETTCLHCVAGDPLVRGRFYLGFYDIGLWRTDDSGKSFRRVMRGQSLGDGTAVAFDPTQTNHVFAAFGVWNDAKKGVVCESFDAGENWHPLGGDGWRPGLVTDLAFRRGALYANVRGRGLVRRSDGAWRDVATPGVVRKLHVTEEAVYIGCGGFVEPARPSGVYRSGDDGKSWVRIFAERTGTIKGLDVKGDRILVGTHDAYDKERGYRAGGAWLSEDAGRSWRKVYSDKFIESVLMTAGWLVLAPRDNPFHDHSCGGGLVASSDGGRTWRSLNSASLWNWNCAVLAADPFDPRTLWNGTHGNAVFIGRLNPGKLPLRSPTVTGVFEAQDGRIEKRSLVGQPGPENARIYRIPKGEAAKWKSIAIFVDGAEAKKGEAGYALTERGLLTRFTKDNLRWDPEHHWMATHYVAITTPRTAFMGVVDGLRYEFLALCEAKNGIYRTYPKWLTGAIDGGPYDDIVYTVYPLPVGSDYNAMAKLYRRHAERKCPDLKTIAEREKSQPSLSYLKKAFAVRRICARKWPADPALKASMNRDFTARDEPPVRCVRSFTDTLEDLKALKAAGVEDVAVCLGGWQTGGYDGRCPASFPVCEEAGGEAALRSLVSGAQALGYLIDAHANYTDSYTCSPVWNGGTVACRRADGTLCVNHDFWDGGRPYDTCLKSILASTIYPDLRRTRDLGFNGCAYIDVFGAAWPYHCLDPKHPATRLEMERLQVEIAKFCRKLNGGFGTECCFDHMIPCSDYINYAQCYIRKMRRWGKEGHPAGWDEVVPFFELAFHDVILSNPDKVTQEIPEGDDRLLLWEFGGRPIVYEWTQGDIPAMKKLFDEFKAYRHLQGIEMLEHRTPAPGVRRIRYANGETLYVNYGGIEARADGWKIPPRSCLLR